MTDLLPIRKVAVTFVGAAMTWGALRLGMDLGNDEANQAAVALVGLVFAYFEKDPRVVAAERTRAPNGRFIGRKKKATA
jgi:hypothetical protein